MARAPPVPVRNGMPAVMPCVYVRRKGFSRTPLTKGADAWTVTLPPSRRPLPRLLQHAPAPVIPTLVRSVMILKQPQRARRAALGATVHDPDLIHSVPWTHNGFLLFRARPHDPGSRTAFGRRLPSFCCRPHPAR